MLKNKFKIIVLILIFILSFTIPVVRAENETDVENGNNATASVESEHNEEGLSEENHNEDEQNKEDQKMTSDMKKNDVYLMGDEVTIDYVVDGNIFVMAKTVNINSQIGGDAFICAQTINIGQQGYIFSNLFALSQELKVDGVVYDLYACSQTVTINGYIYRDIKVASGTLNLNGTVGRNAFVSVEDLKISETNENRNDNESLYSNNAMIYGDLNYSSKNEINIPDGTVTGKVNYSKLDVSYGKTMSNTIQDYIWDLGTFVVTIAIIWLLIIWLAPKFLSNADYLLSKKFLPSLGFGLLTTVATIITAIILLILGITAEVALLSIGLLALLLFIGIPIFTISLNQFICKKLKIEKNILTFGILIATSIVVWLITLVPIVGEIVNLIIKLIGLGLIINYILKNKKESK